MANAGASFFARPALSDVNGTLDTEQLARAAALIVVERAADNLLPEDRVMLASYITEGLDGVAACRMVYQEQRLMLNPYPEETHPETDHETAAHDPGPAYYMNQVVVGR